MQYSLLHNLKNYCGLFKTIAFEVKMQSGNYQLKTDKNK